MNSYEDIIYVLEGILEDYKSFKDEQEERAALANTPEESSKIYKDLATVSNSIRRKATGEKKKARKAYKESAKKALAARQSSGSYASLKASDNALKAYDNYKKVREKERDAQEEVDSVRRSIVSEKCYADIINLIEEYINEVSVGLLSRAAASSLPKRKEADIAANQRAEETGKKVKRNNFSIPPSGEEKQKEFYKKQGEEAYSAARADLERGNKEEKLQRAQDIVNLNLPKNSKVSANSLFKAAHNVKDDRKSKANLKDENSMKRNYRSQALSSADPIQQKGRNPLA